MIINEFPRPQFERCNWLNLNGAWDFEITNSSRRPHAYGSNIIVPFSPETKLSTVERLVKPNEYIYYHRSVELKPIYEAGHILLHFDAVDYEAVVWVNDIEVISHRGGYLPFTVDITDVVIDNRIDIVVQVRDYSDTSFHSRGKQKTDRGGIWYTPQSGIWQTVWIEYLPHDYIESVKITPDYDNKQVFFEGTVIGEKTAYVLFNGEMYPLPSTIQLSDMIPWSPENPYLYNVEFVCGDDCVKSYFAMRKISVGVDDNGIPRLMLNNKVYFHNGILDQGYWQDGLYTAPSDDAMIKDILLAKQMGFNVLRKHIKIEPMRWYYHCDRLGMLVWQDFINGGGKYKLSCITLPLLTGIHFNDSHYRFFSRESEEGRKEFVDEVVQIVNHLYNCPCISLWTIFNEGWGQFDAKQVYSLIKSIDPTRLIDHASGWHDQGIGDLVSKHVYFKKYRYKPDKYGRCVLLSEFGGYNLKIHGHCFNRKNFGYRGFKSASKLTEALYTLYKEQIQPAKNMGLSAAIYTQLSDVEDELNGLVTFDRKVIKIDPSVMKSIISI